MMTTMTSAIDEYTPLPTRGGGGDDAIVIVDKAPYPDEGEAGMAAAEATGEDGKGGASVMPTTTMTTAIKGEDKDKNKDANAVARTTMTTTATTDKDAPLPTKGGGDDDVIVVVIDAPYPNEGEAGMAVAEAMGEDGEGGALVGWPQAGQRSNGTNAPHSISEGICTDKILERTEKDGELTVISPLAFVVLPTAPSSLQGQRWNNPHSISEGGSAAKILETTNNPHSSPMAEALPKF
jgi:hypothetical protein